MPPDIEVDTETTTDAPLSLRDSLEQALETTSAPVEPVELEQPIEPAEGETQEQADARARDEAGRFAKEKKAKPAAVAKPAVVKPVPPVVKPGVKPAAAAVVKPGTVPTSAQPAVPEMKAPQAFRGPAKEAWAQTPEPVRIEVLRREKEIATQLQGIGEERKYASTMKQAFAPFEAQIRAEGSTPDQAIGKLMNTAMLLRTGPPHLKAQAVADMIGTYGIPLDGLVAALQGRQVQPGQHQQQAPQQVDPAAIAEQVRNQLMQQLGTQRETALATKFASEAEKFMESKAVHGLDGTDYGEDIRETMADIIEARAKRGSTITLDQAYSLAAQAHPEVSKVYERQQAAASAVKANASTQRARAAASSVRHQSATEPVGKTDTSSIRSSLEAAVERHSG